MCGQSFIKKGLSGTCCFAEGQGRVYRTLLFSDRFHISERPLQVRAALSYTRNPAIENYFLWIGRRQFAGRLLYTMRLKYVYPLGGGVLAVVERDCACLSCLKKKNVGQVLCVVA